SSLNQSEKRLAVVIEMLIGEDGNMLESSLYRAIVQNKAQLTYDAVSMWLDGKNGKANAPEHVGAVSGPGQRTLKLIRESEVLQEQLRLQDRAAQTLRERRHE